MRQRYAGLDEYDQEVEEYWAYDGWKEWLVKYQKTCRMSLGCATVAYIWSQNNE